MINELERLEKAATPGPWYANADAWGTLMVDAEDAAILEMIAQDGTAPDDARLITTARNALPALLAGIEALRPFAKMAEAIPSGMPDGEMLLSWNAGAIVITVGDVRCAAAALAALEGRRDA